MNERSFGRQIDMAQQSGLNEISQKKSRRAERGEGDVSLAKVVLFLAICYTLGDRFLFASGTPDGVVRFSANDYEKLKVAMPGITGILGKHGLKAEQVSSSGSSDFHINFGKFAYSSAGFFELNIKDDLDEINLVQTILHEAIHRSGVGHDINDPNSIMHNRHGSVLYERHARALREATNVWLFTWIRNYYSSHVDDYGPDTGGSSSGAGRNTDEVENERPCWTGEVCRPGQKRVAE